MKNKLTELGSVPSLNEPGFLISLFLKWHKASFGILVSWKEKIRKDFRRRRDKLKSQRHSYSAPQWKEKARRWHTPQVTGSQGEFYVQLCGLGMWWWSRGRGWWWLWSLLLHSMMENGPYQLNIPIVILQHMSKIGDSMSDTRVERLS